MTKIIFIDLDGTIREPITGKFVDAPKNQRIIPGADKALKYFADKGWVIIGISNQGGIEYGYKSLESTIEEMQYTLELFPKLDSIYFRPDISGSDCIYVSRNKVSYFSFSDKSGYMKTARWQDNLSFRKPGDAMMRAAIEYQLRLRVEEFIEDCELYQNCDCWFIGDRPEDEKAAQNLGVKFMAADVFRNRFLPGMYEVKLSPQAIEFLEGIKLR